MFSTTAYVLSRSDTREADRLYTLFSRDYGKLTVLARGARKARAKVAPHMESFARVHVELAEGRARPVLTGASIEESYHDLLTRSDQAHLLHAGFALIDIGTRERQPDVFLYDLASHWIETVRALPQISPAHAVLLLGAWVLQMMRTLGYAPHLHACVRCQSGCQTPYYWASSLGGVVCGTCMTLLSREGVRVRSLTEPTYKLLRLSSESAFSDLLRVRLAGEVVVEFQTVVEGLMIDHFPVVPAASLPELCHVEIPLSGH